MIKDDEQGAKIAVEDETRYEASPTQAPKRPETPILDPAF